MRHLKKFYENLNIKDFDNDCLSLFKDKLIDFAEDLGYESIKFDFFSREMYPNIVGKFYTICSHESHDNSGALAQNMISSMLSQKLFLVNFSIHTPISRDLLRKIQGSRDSITIYKHITNVPDQLLLGVQKSYNEFNSNFIPNISDYGFRCEVSFNDRVDINEDITVLKTSWIMKVFYEDVDI